MEGCQLEGHRHQDTVRVRRVMTLKKGTSKTKMWGSTSSRTTCILGAKTPIRRRNPNRVFGRCKPKRSALQHDFLPKTWVNPERIHHFWTYDNIFNWLSTSCHIPEYPQVSGISTHPFVSKYAIPISTG